MQEKFEPVEAELQQLSNQMSDMTNKVHVTFEERLTKIHEDLADIIGIPGPNNAKKSVGSLRKEIMNTVRTNFKLLTTKLDGGLEFMVKTTKAVKTRTDVVEQRWAKFNQLYINLESKIKTLEAQPANHDDGLTNRPKVSRRKSESRSTLRG